MNQSKNKLSQNQTFLTILGLIIIITVCIILYMFLKFIWNSIKDYPTITVAVITGFLSIITIVIQRVWEKRYKQEQDIRNQKMPTYQKMVKEFSLFFYNDPAKKTGNIIKDKKYEEEKLNRLIRFVAENNGELITWASDEVLKEWSLFRKIATTNKNPGIELMFQVEKIFYAIRKDLGHKNKNLLKEDILRLWVNDIDNFWGETIQNPNTSDEKNDIN